MMTVRIPGVIAPLATLLQNSDEPLPQGVEILGKYVVERTLGKGGMGIVVAARHQGLGELHAIKFLLPSVLAHSQAITRFEREARAAARLRSEHVARVMDVGRTPTGEPYMVMEYLEGQDLKTILQHGPLPLEDVVEYLLQTCDAVSEAHQVGIVHRDLKPANLFLTIRSNGSPCIKVLDFGIAKISDPNEVELTREGMVGSLKYMPPEQILKSKTADWRADIWQLGMIAYEFVTAQTAFGGTSHIDMVANIMEEEPALPSTLRPDLPASMEAIILRCLRKNRDERFQSVRELADALRDAAGLPSIHAPRMRPFSMSMSGMLAPTLVEEKTERAFGVTDHPVPPAPVRAHKRGPWLVAGVVVAVGSVLGLVGVRRNGPASQPPVLAANAAMVMTSVVEEPLPVASSLPIAAENVAPEATNEVLPDASIGAPIDVRDKRKVNIAVPDVKTPPVASVVTSAHPVEPSSVDKPSAAVVQPELTTQPASSAVVPAGKTETKSEQKGETVKPEVNTGFEFD